MAKTKTNPTAKIIAALQGRIENDDFDDSKSVSANKELELRSQSDELERQFRKHILDELFPERVNGRLYAEAEEKATEIIDY